MAFIEDVRVLYLAKHAPLNGSGLPSEPTVYEKYHFDIFEALKKACALVFPSNDYSVLLKHPEDFDYVFSLYNQSSFRNSEILVSSVAEYYRIPYLGARPNIRALAEDKQLAKLLAEHLGVPTPKWLTYSTDQPCELAEPGFEGPYFVKPRFAAGSRCIDESSICLDWHSAAGKIREILSEGRDAILEQQIKGTYYTSPVLSNFGQHLYLPCIREESNLRDGVVSHAQKRKTESGLVREIEKDQSIQGELKSITAKLYESVCPLDYARFDYIVDDSGVPFFIEFNVCCNLGMHSTFFQAANSLGYSYQELIENILLSSMQRQQLAKNVRGKSF